MTNYVQRLERLEAAIAPKLNEPRVVMIFGEEDDPEQRVAEYRAANNWPDDGLHPVEVLRLVWRTPTA